MILTQVCLIINFTALKPEIIDTLEKYRDEELAERKEKRKKAQEDDEAAKKEKQTKEQKVANDAPLSRLSTTASMEVTFLCQHQHHNSTRTKSHSNTRVFNKLT